jgi:hypothetical protein
MSNEEAWLYAPRKKNYNKNKRGFLVADVITVFITITFFCYYRHL